MKDKECCGTCKYHCYEKADQGWICTKDSSDYCADWTDYDDCCDEYEEKLQ